MKLKNTPWKKSYYQPRQHIKKERHYFANIGLSSQGYGFSSSHVWMWEVHYKESWAELMLLNCGAGEDSWRVPWTARRSNQSILKETSPGCSLEGLMLKLKLQYCGHLMEELTHWKRPWCWDGLGAGEGDDRGWDGWMASPTRCTWIWMNSGSWWWTGRPGVLQFMGSQRVGHDWATELNWIPWYYLFTRNAAPIHTPPSVWRYWFLSVFVTVFPLWLKTIISSFFSW